MKAGVIAIVDDAELDLSDYHMTQEEDGHELARTIRVDEVRTTLDGDEVYFGEAAKDSLVDTDIFTISDDGEIEAEAVTEEQTQKADFVYFPDEFMMVGSSSGTFAFGLVEEAITASVEQADIKLKELPEVLEDAALWKAGFSGREVTKGADKGTLYGNKVTEDKDLAEALEEANWSQAGILHTWDGMQVKNMVAESGYCQVYQPEDADGTTFVQYVRDNIIPVCDIPDDVDEDQSSLADHADGDEEAEA